MESTYINSERKILDHVLEELIKNGKTIYNPVYICGGKKETALLISDFVFQYIRAFPESTIKQYTGESFVADIIIHVWNGELLSAKDCFGDTDLLILENVDYISGKSISMERLFSAFDIVEEHGGQLVFTSEKLPCEMNNLNMRNRTQFEGGLVINIIK